MAIQTVAILSPGDMGHAVGRALRESGLDVVTCLTGRSERTRGLAEKAGIRDIPALEDLVRNADLILSILVPSKAIAAAKKVAQALQDTGENTAYADCNAVSPMTAQRIDTIIAGAGGRFIDAGIIGGPPGPDEKTRFYVSGPYEDLFMALDGQGIDVRRMGGEVGRASGIKMCYASLTKGTAALYAAVLTTAEALGLSPELLQEFSESQPDALKRMQSVKGLSAKAFRWIGEMEEIAATYGNAGVTPKLHLGAADVFHMIAESSIGHERPETIDRTRTLEDTVAIFARHVKKAGK